MKGGGIEKPSSGVTELGYGSFHTNFNLSPLLKFRIGQMS